MVDNLKHQMSGHNYQVTFGVDIFDNCITTDDFKRKLKQTYPNSRPESIDLIQFDKTDIYSYPDEEGIPGYAVYWEFAFL